MAAGTEFMTFSHFLRLPSELRTRIWLEALPDADGSALYSYQKGCWCLRRLTEVDHEYDADDEKNLSLEFRHDLLEPTRVEVPLFLVNDEARNVVLPWICDQGIELGFGEDGEVQCLVRQFDPSRDVLYIAPDRWFDFCNEAYDRLFEPDLLGRAVSHGTDITRIAVPEVFVWSRADELSDIFDWFSAVSLLLIIVDAQPELLSGVEDVVQRRWEVESIQGKAFSWNHDHGRFDLGGGEYIGNEALYRHIEKSCKGLGEILVRDNIRRFEIRPVHATGG
jgi:hypothetical protein